MVSSFSSLWILTSEEAVVSVFDELYSCISIVDVLVKLLKFFFGGVVVYKCAVCLLVPTE